MSEEEIKAIENIINDYEYPSLLRETERNGYSLKNVLDLFLATDDKNVNYGDYSEYEIALAIVYITNLIKKQYSKIMDLEKLVNRLGEYIEDMGGGLVTKESIIENMKKDEFYNVDYKENIAD